MISPHCCHKDHYWKKEESCYEYKKCEKRQSLRANTVMHGSQLPFRYLFVAMRLLSATRKSFSAKELQRQLGHKYYEPVLTMLHKLREAMGKRDSQYTASGVLELDEGFFSTTVKEEEKNQPLKRGHGNQKKAKLL